MRLLKKILKKKVFYFRVLTCAFGMNEVAHAHISTTVFLCIVKDVESSVYLTLVQVDDVRLSAFARNRFASVGTDHRSPPSRALWNVRNWDGSFEPVEWREEGRFRRNSFTWNLCPHHKAKDRSGKDFPARQRTRRLMRGHRSRHESIR